MPRRIAVIGAPLCDGERELGVEKAPSVIREAGLLSALSSRAFRDLGNIALETPSADIVSGKLRNVEHVVSGCQRIKETVAGAAREGDFPLVLGGDCTLILGSLAGMLEAHDRLGVLYVDGHADFHNPETTKSGYFSGMALAAALGRGQGELVRIGKTVPLVRQENVSLIGVRMANLDPPELRDLQESHLNLFTTDVLRRDGIPTTLQEATKSLPKPLYLHFDLDVIDPTEMPALAGMWAGVHSAGGLTQHEADSLCETLATLPLAGMDVTLYDPNLDPQRACARRIVEMLRKILI